MTIGGLVLTFANLGCVLALVVVVVRYQGRIDQLEDELRALVYLRKEGTSL